GSDARPVHGWAHAHPPGADAQRSAPGRRLARRLGLGAGISRCLVGRRGHVWLVGRRPKPMLDLDARIVVATAPDAAVYGDDRDPSRFYAFASRPRVATDAAGRPLLSVLVYRRGKDNPPEGGQVSLTTTLALSAEERAAILQSLPPDRGPGPLGAPVPERRSE